MNKKVAIIISPNWKDYAEKYLADCLESLKKQDWTGESKIFLIDNESTNESLTLLNDIVEAHNHAPILNNIVETQKPPAPPLQGGQRVETQKNPLCSPFNERGQIEIIRNKNNDGFAKGNNDAIKLALAQGFDYIVLFNMDTVVENDCVSELVKAIDVDKSFLDSRLRGNDGKEIGAVQARLMLWPEKEKINSLGNTTHFLGFGYCLGYGGEYNPPHPPFEGGHNREICYPSGAAVLFTAEVLKKVGLFDEEFWMYNEDQDLGWRIWLAGYKCVLAPEAVVFHKYEFAKSIKQYYFMDRNRMLSIIKNYHWLTLILITPACLVMEFGLLLFSLKTGWFKEKIKVWLYFLKPRTWKYLIKARREAQNLRKIKDRNIVKMFSGKIWYQEIGDWKLKLVNPVFQLYWFLVRKIIFW
ncbi:MAG: glycosyltransferase family 2 protein [Patescibacteria group bacterium]|nr:glycosyltransferase family 2 protein [Patescibacteria group bacterium]